MFEVIYISLSCRQAAEFIDRLFWDLRKHEIYDIKIDKKHTVKIRQVHCFGG